MILVTLSSTQGALWRLLLSFSVVALLAMGIALDHAAAQSADPAAPFRDRPAGEAPELPDYRAAEGSGPDFDLPPLPGRGSLPSGGPQFELIGVTFSGNHAFSDEALTAIAAPFIGRAMGLADLEELRYRLTRHYTDRGYFNSGVIIVPGQSVDDGIVDFEVREGRLEEVAVSGTGRLHPDYVRARLWPDPERTLDTGALRERFQLLLEDPLIEKMDGQLRPGLERGSALLDLQVTRAKPYDLTFTVDNHRPPSTGAERGRLHGTLRNLTGRGDALELIAEQSEGATDWEGRFSIPLNARDTRLSLRYDTTESDVVEEPLDRVDIESEYEGIELALSHPLRRSLSGHLILGASFSVRENESRLLDEPFSFSEGEVSGRSKVSTLRLWQDYQSRGADHVFAARSTFSLGTDFFDATNHTDDRPDGQFFAWLGQLQYAQRLWGESQGVLRADLQLTDDKLMPLERYALGGAGSVRGYRENSAVRDQALLLSAELRYPLLSGSHSLQLVPFLDLGRGWNKSEYSDGQDLAGAGLGLEYGYSERVSLSLYWGHDLEELPSSSSDYNLQDSGVHFRLSVDLL